MMHTNPGCIGKGVTCWILEDDRSGSCMAMQARTLACSHTDQPLPPPCRMYAEFMQGVTLEFKLTVRHSDVSLAAIREKVCGSRLKFRATLCTLGCSGPGHLQSSRRALAVPCIPQDAPPFPPQDLELWTAFEELVRRRLGVQPYPPAVCDTLRRHFAGFELTQVW